MITIRVTENGFCYIDVTDEQARAIGKFPFAKGTQPWARALAESCLGTLNIQYVSFRKKRGISSAGWTAIYRRA